VTFKYPTGDEKTFQCTADKNLLEGALAAGVEVRKLKGVHGIEVATSCSTTAVPTPGGIGTLGL
jgi:hypothetical protein